MKKIVLILFCFAPLIHAQTLNIEGEVSVIGIASSENEIPFWMYTNIHGALGSFTNISGTGAFRASYTTGNHTLETGAAFFYRDGVYTDNLQRRDLYALYKNKWLKATLGAKIAEEQVQGLSATNRNFIWSGNARPLPGILLEADSPLHISNTFSLDWGIGHYNLNDDRYVEGVRVHYKRLGLITRFNEKHRLTALVRHYAQWAGTSPTEGKLPDGFGDFIDVFLAKRRSITINGQEFDNAVGNHIGSYLLEYEFKFPVGTVAVSHEHIFEDGSGTRLANFPDGVWAIYFQPEKKKFFTGILYEYIDTFDQSGTTPGSGYDNYFNNNFYRSGWFYEKNIMGMPFFISDSSIVIDEMTAPITSNRTRAHHLGITGTVQMITWKLKTSYVENAGRLSKPFENKRINWYNFASVKYETQNYGAFTLLGALDFNKDATSVAATGIEYTYEF